MSIGLTSVSKNNSCHFMGKDKMSSPLGNKQNNNCSHLNLYIFNTRK